jgi:hypothetical protein
VGPKAGLGAVEKREQLSPGIEPGFSGRPIRSLVLVLHELPDPHVSIQQFHVRRSLQIAVVTLVQAVVHAATGLQLLRDGTACSLLLPSSSLSEMEATPYTAS